MPQSAKSTGKMPPRAAVLFFALSQGLVLPRSLVVFGARIGAPALCCRVGRCRLGKNAPFGTSKRKKGRQYRGVWYPFGQHVRFDTRLMARTEVWYPRSTHGFRYLGFSSGVGDQTPILAENGYQIALICRSWGEKSARGYQTPRFCP